MLRLALLALLIPAASAQPVVMAEEFTPGITFEAPVGVETAPGDDGRFYVVEQGVGGPPRILTLEPGDAQATVFLDLSDRATSGGETGLLSLAFHPDYADNGRFFVDYTARESGQLVSRISEFTRSASDPLQADPASERVVLREAQPAGNHNGGTVAFGPDGFLYVSFGDGGGQGDPFNNGQDPTTLLGAILRLDVDTVPAGEDYGIPPDNPFAGTGGPEREEIWAYGFRNPYKFSVSDAGLWVGDVGQNEWEEVDRVEAGGNYEWNEVEGPECYPIGSSCDLSAFEAPVVWYPHNFSTGGFSITGGFVVQNEQSQLNNYYLYGDFVSGRMWGFDHRDETPEPVVLLESVPDGQGGQRPVSISAIDDAGGRILLTDYDGRIYEITTPSTPAEAAPEAGGLTLALAGPNPARGATAVTVQADGPVRVTVLDALGREVAVLWGDGPAPQGPLTIDGLAPGLYAVRAVSTHRQAVLRLVRVR